MGAADSSPTDLSPYIGHLSSSPPHGPKSDPSHGQEHCFSQPPEAACAKSGSSPARHHSNEIRPSVENEGQGEKLRKRALQIRDGCFSFSWWQVDRPSGACGSDVCLCHCQGRENQPPGAAAHRVYSGARGKAEDMGQALTGCTASPLSWPGVSVFITELQHRFGPTAQFTAALKSLFFTLVFKLCCRNPSVSWRF